MKDIKHRIEILEARHKELTTLVEREFKHYEDDIVVEQHKKEKLAIKDEIQRLSRQLVETS